MKAENSVIYAVSRQIENLRARFGAENERLYFIESDVSLLESDVKFDVIINAASNAYPYVFKQYPVETLLGNITGTYRIMEIARNNPRSRVLYVSSGEVQEYVNHLTSRACYPMGKKASETLCVSYAKEYGTNVVIARPCHTFGANFTKSDNRATAQFIHSAALGEDIVLYSSGLQVRSFMYVADCASALLYIVANGMKGKIYGVATDETCSIKEFAQKCADVSNTKVIVRQPSGAEISQLSPIQNQIVNNDELKKLGWKPLYTVKEGIRRSIETIHNYNNEGER
jgi:nucleoside-diphosphate-sugar epimerase